MSTHSFQSYLYCLFVGFALLHVMHIVISSSNTHDDVAFRCCRSELQASSVTSSVAVHEFRIPRGALLGLHSYCPVHFDAFHSVLVDLTLHTVYLKAGATKTSLKVHRFVKL